VKTLALHIIARDSEETLCRTLESVKGLFDQIVVVDTGSRDATLEVAKDFGAETYEFEWIDDFSAARNYALSKVTCDWAMWLDTGDVLKPENLSKLRELKKADWFLTETTDLVWIHTNRLLDEWGNPRVTSIFPRIARMKANPYWENRVHEVLSCQNPRYIVLDDVVIEDPYTDRENGAKRNLRILDQMIADGDNSSRTKLYRARELRDVGRYDDAVLQFADFLKVSGDNWEKYEALLDMGHCHAAIGNFALTLQSWLNAIAYDPSSPEAWMLVADMHIRAGQFSKSIPFLRGALGAKKNHDGRPINPMVYDDAPYAGIAYAYAQMGENEKALAHLKMAAQVSDNPRKYDAEIIKARATLESRKSL